MLLFTAALLLALTPHQARQRPLGSTVTVDGFVTVPSGVFNSFMQDQGFVLNDPISGIYSQTQNKGYRSLGSAVEVRGELAEEHGLLVLRARHIRLKRGHRLISPRRIELSQVDEIREGQIVRLEGEVARPLVDDLPAGYKLFLRGAGTNEVQVFLPPSVHPDPAMLTPGRRLEVTGWCAQYNQTYEVIVRSARDLQPRSKVSGSPPGVNHAVTALALH